MDERVIAIHEAGHAIIARALGIGVTHIAMFDTAGRGDRGNAQTRSATFLAIGADRQTQIKALENDTKVSLAGPIAQQKIKPRKFKIKKRLPDEWQNDYDNAEQSLIKAAMLETDQTFELTSGMSRVSVSKEQQAMALACFDRIRDETAELVEKLWPIIERTADELLQRRIISGDEIDAILNDGNYRRPINPEKSAS